jgi:hypothetical protein
MFALFFVSYRDGMPPAPSQARQEMAFQHTRQAYHHIPAGFPESTQRSPVPRFNRQFAHLNQKQQRGSWSAEERPLARAIEAPGLGALKTGGTCGQDQGMSWQRWG